MGTNILYLADFGVPSYRRARTNRPTPAGDAASGAWSALARRRGAQHAQPLALAAERPHLPVQASAPAALPRPGAAHGTPTATSMPTASGPTAAPSTARAPSPGQLRLCGRLIDVCAELERLAALEAAQALPRPLRA